MEMARGWGNWVQADLVAAHRPLDGMVGEGISPDPVCPDDPRGSQQPYTGRGSGGSSGRSVCAASRTEATIPISQDPPPLSPHGCPASPGHAAAAAGAAGGADARERPAAVHQPQGEGHPRGGKVGDGPGARVTRHPQSGVKATPRPATRTGFDPVQGLAPVFVGCAEKAPQYQEKDTQYQDTELRSRGGAGGATQECVTTYSRNATGGPGQRRGGRVRVAWKDGARE